MLVEGKMVEGKNVILKQRTLLQITSAAETPWKKPKL